MKKSNSHNSKSLAAVFRAVQECRAKPAGDPQRIIVLLAPQDFGLPAFYYELLRQRGAVLVQASSLDKGGLGFLKLLAHRTRLVPLVLASAGFWRRWNQRRSLESAQIRRRTHLVVEFEAFPTAKMAVEIRRLDSVPDTAEKAKVWRELRLGLMALRRGELQAEKVRLERDKYAQRLRQQREEERLQREEEQKPA